MAKFELIGDKENLKSGPKSVQATFTKGPGMFEMVGDSVPMSKTPVSLQMSEKSKGSFQMVGDKVSMSSTPHKGWDSASTPLSDRAIFQSKIKGGK